MRPMTAAVMTVLAVATTPAPAARLLDLQPGMWESRLTVQMEGMPSSFTPQTEKRCLTAADIAKGEQELLHPASQDPDQKCTVKDFRHSGNTITLHWLCTTSEGSADIAGKVVIDSRTAYHGGMDGDIVTPMGPMKMHQRITGKRTGSCP